MDEQELATLQKTVKRAKRIASERAGELHDLVEDRLPQDFEAIPGMAKACYDACQEWATLNAKLKQAESLIQS